MTVIYSSACQNIMTLRVGARAQYRENDRLRPPLQLSVREVVEQCIA